MALSIMASASDRQCLSPRQYRALGKGVMNSSSEQLLSLVSSVGQRSSKVERCDRYNARPLPQCETLGVFYDRKTFVPLRSYERDVALVFRHSDAGSEERRRVVDSEGIDFDRVSCNRKAEARNCHCEDRKPLGTRNKPEVDFIIHVVCHDRGCDCQEVFS